jgi:acyl-CoA synthetase (AMP-forming)/AMP-acid ligase II
MQHNQDPDSPMLRAECFWSLLQARVDATPDALLAVDDRGRRTTFAEYQHLAEVAAAGLTQRGVGPGSTVSWQLPTWTESLVLAGALARLGAVQNPIIPLNRQREVAFMVDQLSSDLLVVPSVWRGFDFEDMAESIQAEVDGLGVLVLDQGLPEGDPSTLPPPILDQGSATRWVLYTSGTTADPKGAQHSDATLLHSAYGMSERMHMGPADRNAIAFPVTHIGGLTLLFGNLAAGSASILLETFTPEGIEVLDREGVTLAGSGTPFNLAYLKAQQEAGQRRLFPSVKAFPGGGSSRPPWMHQRLTDAFDGAGLLSGYGLTETGFLAFADLDDPDDAKALTEGRAYPGCELRIVDDSGHGVPPGVEGEICARGPMVMSGYVDATLDDAFDEEGYFHTGDLGILDEDGFLRITGRLKEIIIRKGENISALEVETLLATHPDVLEVAVVGLPDDETGERACAVVVPADAAHAPDLPTLAAHLLAAGLSRHKVPEQLEVVDTLPRTATGKVTKRFLQERFAGPQTNIARV